MLPAGVFRLALMLSDFELFGALGQLLEGARRGRRG